MAYSKRSGSVSMVVIIGDLRDAGNDGGQPDRPQDNGFHDRGGCRRHDLGEFHLCPLDGRRITGAVSAAYFIPVFK